MKELKLDMFMAAMFYMILGIILLLFPATTARTVCFLIAGIAIAVGAVSLMVYVMRNIAKNYYRNDFVMGLILIVLGIFVIYRVDMVIALVPFIIGLCIIVSGLFKLQSALDVQRMGGNAVVILGVAIVNIVVGILMVINPFESALLLYRLLGAGLLFSGLTDMISTIYLSSKMDSYKRKQSEADEAIKVTEISPQAQDEAPTESESQRESAAGEVPPQAQETPAESESQQETE